MYVSRDARCELGASQWCMIYVNCKLQIKDNLGEVGLGVWMDTQLIESVGKNTETFIFVSGFQSHHFRGPHVS